MSNFEIYYVVTGSLGIAYWLSRTVIPWLRLTFTRYYLRDQFNPIFFTALFLAAMIYLLQKWLGLNQLLFIFFRIALGIGSIYILVLVVDLIAKKTRIRLDVTIGVLGGLLFLGLTYHTVKNYMIPDIVTHDQVRILSFKKDNLAPILVGNYHEQDAFTYQSDGDFLLQLQDNNGQLKGEYSMAKSQGFGWYHSLAESGQLFVAPLTEGKTSKVNFNVIHRLGLKKLAIRNHWFLRHAIPYCFLVFVILFLTPKRQVRRLLMKDDSLQLSKDVDKALEEMEQLIFNNPLSVGSIAVQQFLVRLGFTQLRWTVKSRKKLYKELYGFITAKGDFQLTGLENAVKEAKLKAKKAFYEQKEREYGGEETKTKADREWGDAAKDYYQTKASQEFNSIKAIQLEAKRQRDHVNSRYQTGEISWEEAKKEFEMIDDWEKRMIDELKSRL